MRCRWRISVTATIAPVVCKDAPIDVLTAILALLMMGPGQRDIFCSILDFCKQAAWEDRFHAAICNGERVCR